MRKITAVAMLLALVAVACKIETNVVANLEADGTGTVMFEVGFDQEAQDLLLQDTDPFDEAPPGAETSEETRDGIRYFQFTLPFSSPAELEELMLQSEQAPFETFSATFSETSVTVDASTGDSGGGFFDEGDLEGFDPAQLEESISASITITMPGRVVSTTADEQNGSTLVWNVPLFGGSLDVSAESDPTQEPAGDGGVPVWLIAVIVLAVAGIGFFVFQRTRRTPAPVAPATDPATDDGGAQLTTDDGDTPLADDDETTPPPTGG